MSRRFGSTHESLMQDGNLTGEEQATKVETESTRKNSSSKKKTMSGLPNEYRTLAYFNGNMSG